VYPHKENDSKSSQSILHLLRKRIAGGLRSGVLEHGDRLSSVREVSEEFDTDPRVVLSAYQQLVEEGIVEIRDRSGVYATGAHTSAGGAVALPKRWILETIVGAIQRDVPPLWLVEQIRAVLLARSIRAVLVECNIDQMESMREELAVYYGVEVITMTFDYANTSAGLRELRSADLLISGGHTDDIARLSRSAGKPYVITSVRPALLRRLSRLLTQGPFYFLVTDRAFGDKMRGLVAPMPRSENFHVLIAGEDDLRVIPAGAPTYVMRSAQTRVGAKRHAGREIPPQRIFSEESSRAILARILEHAGELREVPIDQVPGLSQH
jgi:DNA-binding transcriptional regulator YhcF (GntR family)